MLSVRKLRAEACPRIAWQVFGSARHVQGRDIDYVHDASRVLITSEAVPGAGGRGLAGRAPRLEIELAREALWVVA